MDFSNYIDGIEKIAAEKIKAEQGDFILDGLLHCGKCKTPKQCRVTILGIERTPYCLCKCEEERRDREEAERRRVEFLQRVKQNRQICFSEEKPLSWTFENDDRTNPKITEAMRRYVEQFDDFRKQGKGLLLYGTVGTGKSYFAACVANALLDRGYPVYMRNFIEIASALSETWDKQGYYDSLNRFPLLILDDLAAERKTEYMSEIVYNVIDARSRAGLPLIITSNLTGAELQNPSDMAYKRAFSRIYEMCIPVKVEGKDRRAEKLKSDVVPMKKLLGL